MKEFIYFSYEEKNEHKIDLQGLYAHLKLLNYKHYVTKSNSGPYLNSIKIQCTFTEDSAFKNSQNVLFSGESKGIYSNTADNSLSNKDIIDLIETSDIRSRTIEFEGTLSFIREYNDSVVVQNDIEGYRKIFFYRNEGLICISSFMPLILVTIKENWKLGAESFIRYFSSRESSWPLTIVDSISVLEPKTKIVFDRKNQLKSHFVFSDNLSLKRKSIHKINQDLKSTYKRQFKSIEENYSAIVPLSGGFDSSSILKCAVDVMKDKPHAISIGYQTERFKDNNVYDETIFAEKIAKFYKVPFVKHVASRDQFMSSFEHTLNIVDQPAFDPSSFCLMSGFAKEKGYTALVSGMGGDALYKSKLALKLYFRYFNLFKRIPQSTLNKTVSVIDQRGPLAYLMHLYDESGKAWGDPFSVLYRSKVSPLTKSFFRYPGDEIFEEGRLLQSNYWQVVQSKSKTIFDIVYSYISLTNPDEYHAYLSAERQNIAMMQPFVTIDSVLELINASKYHPNVNSRQFLVNLFGVNTDILYKGKSGLSIPYYDWANNFADTVFDFWAESHFFSKCVDYQKIREQYNLNRDNNQLNILVWKLYVAMRYVEKYNISIN